MRPKLRRFGGRIVVVVVSHPLVAGAVAGELPLRWSAETGENVRWSAAVGSVSYAGPVVAGGKVFVGTNNARPRDPTKSADLGVLMVFQAADGMFLWQATHQKLSEELDFPMEGLCSTPTVVDDRVYYVSNRGELMCVDSEGFIDDENDGPFVGESRQGEEDADVVWRLDMREELGVVPHFMSASTPAVVGDLVFVVTSNGIDDSGRVPAPEAASFIAVDRESGELRWKDASPGMGLVDGQWASPTAIGGGALRSQVLFPGGDGWLYSFDPSGMLLWKFDGNAAPDREAPVGRDRHALVASAVVSEGRAYFPMGRDPEQGSAPGSLWSLDLPSGEAPSGPEIGPEVAWHFGGESFGRAIATVAVEEGLVYAADLDGFVVALDAASGELYWRYDALASIWASPLVVEDKVYVADTDGEVTVLRAGRTLEVLSEIVMGAPIFRSLVADGESLYLLTSEVLYALAMPESGRDSPPQLISLVGD